MKNPTAEDVLKKTFDHLEKVLEEQGDEKTTEESTKNEREKAGYSNSVDEENDMEEGEHNACS